MISTWLAAQGLLGIKNQWWLLIIGLIIAASLTIIEIADNAERRKLDTAKEAGAATAVVEGQRTTLSQTEKANEAGNEVRDDRGNARYDQCLRDATADTRSNCERYRRN